MTIGNAGIGSIQAFQPLEAISPTRATPAMTGLSAGGTSAPDGTGSFGDYLLTAIGDLNAMQQQSTAMTDDFIAGRTDSIHEVLIAAEKASIALQLTLEVRNKVLEAYQEINRMQI